jgi:spermidine/putrescine transport system permease protein
LPIFIYTQLRFPQKLPGVLALGACILAVSFVVVFFAQWLRRRGIAGSSNAGV